MNIINDFKNLSLDLKKRFLENNSSINKEKFFNHKKEFVLDVDMHSQDVLREISIKYHRNSFFVSEEMNNYRELDFNEEKIVIVDPLDGTHNFLHKLPIWGFSYTVFSKSKIPTESYISLPMQDVLIIYKDKKIFYLNIESDFEKEIFLKVSDNNLSQMMVAFDNQFYKKPDEMKNNFLLVVDNSFTTRISGSALFDIAMLIIGKLDARIWHDVEIYDVAPLFAFFQGFNGLLNLKNGKTASLEDKSLIASTSDKVYDQLKRVGLSLDL